MTEDRDLHHGSSGPRRPLSYRIGEVGPRWTMLIGFASIFALNALGCAGDESAPAPPPLHEEGAPAPPPPPQTEMQDESQQEASEEELNGIVLPPPESTFAGSLATSATVAFGGGGFCKYDITLRDIAIEVGFAANGDVTRASVRDLAVEKALDNCPYSAMDPSIQDFTLKSMAITTTGTRVELVGAKTNRPQTALVIDLVQTSAGYDVIATWKRTDQKAPLAWSVTAKTKLTKK